MDHRSQVAHHEAAHAVFAIQYALGISSGIDLDGVTSVEGAYGVAGVNLIEPDTTLPEDEQRLDLRRNLMVFCAGAASDAKIKGISLEEALDAQPGDKNKALEHAKAHPLIAGDEDAEWVVQELGLKMAAKDLDKLWPIIEDIAQKAMAAGGKLSADEIGAIVSAGRGEQAAGEGDTSD